MWHEKFVISWPRNVLKATIDVPEAGELNFYCTHLDHLDENWRMKQINAIIQSNDEPHILAGGLNSLDESDYSQERWTDIVKVYISITQQILSSYLSHFIFLFGLKSNKEEINFLCIGSFVFSTMKRWESQHQRLKWWNIWRVKTIQMLRTMQGNMNQLSWLPKAKVQIQFWNYIIY